MIKRMIEISREPCHLSVRLNQLVVQPNDTSQAAARTIPCEDIGLVLIDHPQVTMTHRALTTLMEFGAAVMVCGKNHLPCGLLVPLSEHTQVVWRVQDQINASLPVTKRLWQQIVQAKVRAQAQNLPPHSPTRAMLLKLAGETRSGDTSNIEAQAARIYWSSWLQPDGTPASFSSLTAQAEIDSPNNSLKPGSAFQPFVRDSESLDPLNVLLNYGYAVLRAAVARALVSAGLFPAMGIHHRHRSNTFALADDLMEPLRPLVDIRVRELHTNGKATANGLDQMNKAFLLDVLNHTVSLGDQTGPLMVALHRYTASFLRCLKKEEEQLLIPTGKFEKGCG